MSTIAHLNEQATSVILVLLQKLQEHEAQGGAYLRLKVPDYHELIVESVELNSIPVFGVVRIYSICHAALIDGQYQRIPEMFFMVTGQDNEQCIYPMKYIDDANLQYEGSMSIDADGKCVIDDRYYVTHINYTQRWMQCVKDRGFLEALPQA